MEIENRRYRVFDYIRIPFIIVPVPIMCMAFLRFFAAAVPSLQVLATSRFIDTAVSVFKSGETTRIYTPLISIMVLVGLSWLSSMLLIFVKLRFNLKINEVWLTAVVKKRSRLAYRHIENNGTWELVARIGEDPSNQITKGFDNLLNIIEYVVKVISLLLIIVTQVWWVTIVIVAIAVPLFALASKSGEDDYEAYSDAESHRRRADYLKEVLSSRECVEERSLFGYSKGVDKMWSDRFDTARKIEYKAMKRNFIRMKTASIITALLSMAIALVLLTLVSSGKITVGMYISLVTAAFSLVQQMSWELSVVMQEYAKNKLYLRDLTEFSALEETSGADFLPDVSVTDMPFESLEFRNVYFTYPGTDRKILNGLSFRLEKNKQYAFVGRNGAGKTTVIKLLTGLYDNYEGEILVNGKNLRSFTQEQLKAYFSVVFQDFVKYNVSLKDNILLGYCRKTRKSDREEALVEKALDSVEMTEEVQRLPEGIDTPLGKLSEGGVDLSGGQWQRIAVARTLTSSAPIYVLDEPTASLDPISECKMYELFGKVSKGKSTILITHRLGAAKIADQILVV